MVSELTRVEDRVTVTHSLSLPGSVDLIDDRAPDVAFRGIFRLRRLASDAKHGTDRSGRRNHVTTYQDHSWRSVAGNVVRRMCR